MHWDAEILDLLNIPASLLPEVKDTGCRVSARRHSFGGEIPILGVAGDQQAATLGQACFAPGMMKSTYGTGLFCAFEHRAIRWWKARTGCLGTIAYQFDGKPTYALEGSIFVAGAVVQWLRDGLKTHREPRRRPKRSPKPRIPSRSFTWFPAFVGLGAPYWDPEARGAIFGLTRGSGPAEFARAALESVGFQTRDLWEAMGADWAGRGRRSGVARRWRDERVGLVDAVSVRHSRRPCGPAKDPRNHGPGCGLGRRYARRGVPRGRGFAETWALERRFTPAMDEATRSRRYEGWRDAVARTLSQR